VTQPEHLRQGQRGEHQAQKYVSQCIEHSNLPASIAETGLACQGVGRPGRDGRGRKARLCRNPPGLAAAYAAQVRPRPALRLQLLQRFTRGWPFL